MKTKLWLDDAESRVVVQNEQDCADILEDNKRFRDVDQTGDFRKVATIPNIVLTQWLNEEWARGNRTLTLFSPEFSEVIRRKLLDSDWQELRTAKGGTKWR